MAPGDLVLNALDVIDLVHVLLLCDLVQLRFQHLHRIVTVLELAALRLAADHDAGGLVDQTHCRRGLVDVLAAGTRGAEHLHLDIFRADVHLNGVVQLRHDLQRGKAGLAAGIGVKRRHAHQAVHAILALEQAVGVGALHHHGSALHAGFVTILVIQHFHRHAVCLCPLVVHTVQHFCPVLCLGAAGTGMEGEDGVAVVVLTVQHGHQLQLVHCLAHSVHSLLGFGDHLRVIFLIQHHQHGLGIIVQALQLFKAAQFALEVAHLIKHFFAQLGIIIKARAGHGMLQLLHTLAAGLNGQGFFQVLHGVVVFSQLNLQLVGRNHLRLPFSPSVCGTVAAQVQALYCPCDKSGAFQRCLYSLPGTAAAPDNNLYFIHRYFTSIPTICGKVKRKNSYHAGILKIFTFSFPCAESIIAISFKNPEVFLYAEILWLSL